MFKIIGTGHALPERVVTNDELSTFLDTSDEWISKRTGIKSRHVITDETLSQLAARAAANALEMACVKAEELDLIIATSCAPEKVVPGIGCMVQELIGASCPAFDISSACSGFLMALDAATAYFGSGRVKKMLVVSAENMTRFVDWTDRSTCVLFGDGAGAVVLGEGDNLLSIKMHTHGTHGTVGIQGSRGNSPFETVDRSERNACAFMNGQETYKYAIGAMSGDIVEAAALAGVDLDAIDHIVPHQANLRIIAATQAKLGIPMEKFCTGIEYLGNTSSASEPIVLDVENRKGRFKEGDILAFTAFGGGLTDGGAVYRW